ncbi:MAG: hypothetical protein K0Q79_663 [Flavipsychrobacter sp.]|jgi:hypothetical protein|nr:hypothetical protein [Flavipsychrobacter sp.]
MKRIVALLIFCVFYIPSSYAQADSIHVINKWCAKKDSLLLFIAGNNLIQVYSRTLKPADIKVRSLDKSLRIGKPEIKGDTLSVLAMPFPAKGEKMRFAVLDAKTSKQIKVVSFICDTIPEPVAMFGNLKGTEAKRKDIVAQVKMNIVFPGSLYAYPYTIKGYTFKISHAKGSATIPVRGFFLINDVIKEIGAAPDGTTFDIVNIMATCPDCATRMLDNLKIKIR